MSMHPRPLQIIGQLLAHPSRGGMTTTKSLEDFGMGPLSFLWWKARVGGLEHDFCFSIYIYIGNLFIPTDDSYFSEGRLKHQPDYIKCKDDDVGTLGWSRSFSVYPDQHPSLTSKRLPWYQGLDPVPMCMMIKEPSKPGSESGLSDMVNILPVLFSLLLLL